jgi:hypothetical protein
MLVNTCWVKHIKVVCVTEMLFSFTGCGLKIFSSLLSVSNPPVPLGAFTSVEIKLSL